MLSFTIHSLFQCHAAVQNQPFRKACHLIGRFFHTAVQPAVEKPDTSRHHIMIKIIKIANFTIEEFICLREGWMRGNNIMAAFVKHLSFSRFFSLSTKAASPFLPIRHFAKSALSAKRLKISTSIGNSVSVFFFGS